MLIDFQSPIYPISADAQRAFMDILNLILLCDELVEFERLLRRRDLEKRLSSHFKWSFADYSFTLWQRSGVDSNDFFINKVLEIKLVAMMCKDKYKMPRKIN